MGTWLLRCDLERPVFCMRVVATEAQVHALRTSELVITTVAQVGDDLSLLLLSEARAGESGNCNLFQGGDSWLMRLSTVIAFGLAEDVDQSTNRCLGAIV